MRGSTASKIPPELIDTIIDYFHSDKTALALCSSVCRSWMPSSRYHLFHSVSLHTWTVTKYISLLDSPLCTFLPYVRNLELYEGSGRYPEDPKWFYAHSSRLNVFKSIESLHLSGMDIHGRDFLLSPFEKLKSFSMKYSVFESFAQFTGLLSSSPLLENISLERVRCDSDAWVPLSMPGDTLRRLKTLQVSFTLLPSLFRWLLSHERPPLVNSLHCACVSSSDTPWIERYLLAIGPHLHHFALGLDYGFEREYEDDDLNKINLSYNTGLRSVHLERVEPDTEDQWMTRTGWICPILSRITSYCIEDIAFNVWLDIPEDLDRLPWDDMAALFAQPQFSSLRTINFRIYGSVSRLVVSQIIGIKLPACDRRGLIKVD